MASARCLRFQTGFVFKRTFGRAAAAELAVRVREEGFARDTRDAVGAVARLQHLQGLRAKLRSEWDGLGKDAVLTVFRDKFVRIVLLEGQIAIA